jgi:leucyl-tRNA synthetase
MKKYDHIKTEKKWRQVWEDQKLYQAPPDATKSSKFYILPQLPYPSGEGLHMGHSSTYIACDIYARYMRMQGRDVLQVIGWDAFGLPAENYAIKTNIHPRPNTDKAIANFREQIKSLGISLDWDREVGSHDPDYYKWTQWFFLFMLERGLAYRKKQAVNWCEQDKTVLANEQVENGKCERCGSEVIQKEMEQWFFKITEYADRLYDDLDKVDWPGETVKRQRDWIGRSEGADVTFQIVDTGAKEVSKLKVFTTAHDTIYGATFVVVAPEHEFIGVNAGHIANYSEVEAYIEQSGHKTELERQQQKEKTGVKLEGVMAVNPANGEQIPIFVADYVLAGYGTGAIMAVPAHDERDMEFAQKYDLAIVEVVEHDGFLSYTKDVKANPADYKIKNSHEFDGQTFDIARLGIFDKLAKLGVAKERTTYRLRDWSISRQRFWGAPIPIVYDTDGKPHTVALEDLPVILPDDVDFKPTGQSPLTYSESFQDGVEQKYGKGWKREVDTLDTFMCSSWYFFRYIDPHNTEAFASEKALKTWMPVDFYLGGPEHVNGHLLYSRFFTKVLFDAGYIDFDEPFSVNRHQGLVLGPDGKKMGKRWGNIISPTDVVKTYGADTTRLYTMFMGPLEADKSWSEDAVKGVYRFIQRVVDFQTQNSASWKHAASEITLASVHQLIKKVGEDIPNLRFNVSVAEFMKVLNSFESTPEKVTLGDWEAYLTVLAPFAPFSTEMLWNDLGRTHSLHLQKWPEYNADAAVEDEIEIAIQINGKTRDVLMLSSSVTEDEALKLVKSSERLKKHLEDREIRKVIYVPGKVINLVV